VSKEAVTTRVTNKVFAQTDESFHAAVNAANDHQRANKRTLVERTARQASKFRRHRGLAYLAKTGQLSE